MTYFNSIILIILLLLLYFWITKPSESMCNKFSSCNDLKNNTCWEPSQMQALIDNSPTQGVQCDIRPDCSKYMYDGRFNVV